MIGLVLSDAAAAPCTTACLAVPCTQRSILSVQILLPTLCPFRKFLEKIHHIGALFSSKIFGKMLIVPISFVFDKYCLIMV